MVQAKPKIKKFKSLTKKKLVVKAVPRTRVPVMQVLDTQKTTTVVDRSRSTLVVSDDNPVAFMFPTEL